MSEPMVTISLKEYEELLNKKTGKPRAKVIPGLLKGEVRNVMNRLDVMVPWCNTPQGHDYWSDVNRNLNILLGYEEG